MKDPAFLFYPNDFAAGTMLLNEHQIGCYIRLLIAQFNNGPLSIDDIKLVLGSNFGSWSKIQSKFCLDNERYYNQRLYDEMNKRSKFTASRRSNASSQKHMLQHMEDRNENEDRNIIKSIYGEFKNVLLTPEEHQKLMERLGESNTNLLIAELDTGIASKGYKYKSHYATILNWVRRKTTQNTEKPPEKKKVYRPMDEIPEKDVAQVNSLLSKYKPNL